MFMYVTLMKLSAPSPNKNKQGKERKDMKIKERELE